MAPIDNLWLMLGGMLVFFMHSGFALLEVGSVSLRNTQNILFKNILSPTMSAILFWAFGYSIAYGNGCDAAASGGFIGGKCYYALAGGDKMVFKTVSDDGSVYFTPPSDGTVAGGIGDPLGNCTVYPDQLGCVGAGMPGYHGKFYATWFFQWAFCATASTIVSGAVAERIALKTYTLITICMSGFIYPVVAHWGWSEDGWASAYRTKGAAKLFDVGVIDFAGSGAVHMVGGIAALVGCMMIGPRHGRFVKHYKHTNGRWYSKVRDQNNIVIDTDIIWVEIVEDEDGQLEMREADEETLEELLARGDNPDLHFKWKDNPFPHQNATFQTFGCLILWFGWYGFNGASTLGLSHGADNIAAKVMVNTTLGAASGALTVALLYQIIEGVQDLGGMSNGILAGLVSITSACASVEPWAALFCGGIGGILYYFGVKLLSKLRVDDVVLAIPVHCFCGSWGCLSPGLFSSPMSTFASYGRGSDGGLSCGILYGETDGCSHAGDQLAAQIVYMLAIVAWVGSALFVALSAFEQILKRGSSWEYSVDEPTPLAHGRVEQMKGLDTLKHGGIANPETHTAYDDPTNAFGGMSRGIGNSRRP